MTLGAWWGRVKARAVVDAQYREVLVGFALVGVTGWLKGRAAGEEVRHVVEARLDGLMWERVVSDDMARIEEHLRRALGWD